MPHKCSSVCQERKTQPLLTRLKPASKRCFSWDCHLWRQGLAVIVPTDWENPAANAMQRQRIGEALQIQRIWKLMKRQWIIRKTSVILMTNAQRGFPPGCLTGIWTGGIFLRHFLIVYRAEGHIWQTLKILTLKRVQLKKKILLQAAAQLRGDVISNCCYVESVHILHNHPPWATSHKKVMAWYSIVEPSLLSGSHIQKKEAADTQPPFTYLECSW